MEVKSSQERPNVTIEDGMSEGWNAWDTAGIRGMGELGGRNERRQKLFECRDPWKSRGEGRGGACKCVEL